MHNLEDRVIRLIWYVWHVTFIWQLAYPKACRRRAQLCGGRSLYMLITYRKLAKRMDIWTKAVRTSGIGTFGRTDHETSMRDLGFQDSGTAGHGLANILIPDTLHCSRALSGASGAHLSVT
ncbi:hypothetical protein PLICRDRAFT_418515 [Plicaturopsis crispa FD-325 SS-3]|nr:hypothetical protein PLICRDRAFT_418515 [Plicaturopsis crispa FD-325 SS-3]